MFIAQVFFVTRKEESTFSTSCPFSIQTLRTSDIPCCTEWTSLKYLDDKVCNVNFPMLNQHWRTTLLLTVRIEIH